MPRLTKEEREAFLQEKRVIMKIAVVRPDGSPLVTPLWFICRDSAIWFTPREKAEWFACLRQEPRVSLVIDEQPLPYRKVMIDGVAELVHDVGEDDAWRELYRDLARRYVPAKDADAYVDNTINERRGLFRVVLSDARVRTWRLPVGEEAGEGIWHSRYYQDPNMKFGDQ
jgi:nitroimidazol reductase NimA-like FMN-containing flavoprotein (pyridoxamine 5'-phosphate oxidase superfamily)